MKEIFRILVFWLVLYHSAIGQPAATGQTVGIGQPGIGHLRSRSEVDLIPESVTYSPSTGRFYISSINRHKIVEIDPAGLVRDFIGSSEHGYLEGLGLKVDEKRHLLWALSNQRDNNRFVSRVQAFGLLSHRLYHSLELVDTISHLFNDLVVLPDGRIFVTDTEYGAVYTAAPPYRQLRLYCQNLFLPQPNGICSDGKQLFVATTGHGIVRIDLSTGRTIPFPPVRDSVNANNIDGMILVKNSLYTVCNGMPDTTQISVEEFRMDGGHRRIIAERILDRNNALFHIPTGITFAHQRLYVLANTYLDIYFQHKKSLSGLSDKLEPVTLLIYKVR